MSIAIASTTVLSFASAHSIFDGLSHVLLYSNGPTTGGGACGAMPLIVGARSPISGCPCTVPSSRARADDRRGHHCAVLSFDGSLYCAVLRANWSADKLLLYTLAHAIAIPAATAGQLSGCDSGTRGNIGG